MDDGSTDGSGELADCLARNNGEIRVYHQSNQGVSAARNVGVDLARGEWVWFVDADDVPSSTWLENICQYFEYGKYDIIFSNFLKSFPDGREEYITTGIVGEIGEDDLPCCYMEQQYTSGYFGFLWCKLLRKSFMEKCSASFQKGLTLAEDLKYLVSLYVNNPRCIFTEDIALCYTVDAVNSSKAKKVDYRAQLEIRFDIYQWIKNTIHFEHYQHELRKHISQYVAFVFFYGFEEHHNILEEASWLISHPEYTECLETKQMSGIMKWIIALIERGQYGNVSCLLKWRVALRNIYRRILNR